MLTIVVSISSLSEFFAGTDVKPAGREEQHHNSDINEICHKAIVPFAYDQKLAPPPYGG